MTWTRTKTRDEDVLNSFGYSATTEIEPNSGMIIIVNPQFQIFPEVEPSSSDEFFHHIAVWRGHSDRWHWTETSFSDEIEEDDQPDQIAWDDIEGLQMYAAKFRNEERGLAKAGMKSYARKLREIDNM